MKLATYAFDDGARVALVEDGMVADLRLAEPLAALLDAPGRVLIETAAAAARRQPLDRARLLAPVPRPPLFIGVGLNYRDTARPLGEPAVFTKPQASIAPPFAAISSHWPSLDYEGELGIVIGRRAHRVPVSEAAAFIGGYVVVNDVTVRELLRPDALLLAKGGAGHAPFGPWLTTPDEAGDPHDLALRTWVNGELRQTSNTRELHRDCFALVAMLSAALVLEPGTVIATGSPRGAGAGFDPPRWLVPGDVVRVEIERLGAIEQRVAAA